MAELGPSELDTGNLISITTMAKAAVDSKQARPILLSAERASGQDE